MRGFGASAPRWRWPALITVWHVDPERDGTDDSCDWFGRKRKLSATEEKIMEACWDLETLLDNKPHYPDSPEHKAWQPLHNAIHELRRRRRWRWHPRWHFWHWRFQVHPVQEFKRWAFSRCRKCGKRFTWGYSPVSNSWNGPGPRWFRGEPDVEHGDCRKPESTCEASAP